MMKPLKQFVPQEVCLSCDGCCRYKEESSAWRPKVSHEEVNRHVERRGDLAEQIFSKDAIDKKGFIKAHSCGGHFECHYFNGADNTCRIYGSRPFECELYPFLLTRISGQIVICMHLNCPHIEKTMGSRELLDYIGYLKNYFSRKEVFTFIEDNPELIGDYSAYQNEFKVLFSLTTVSGKLNE